MIPALDPLLTEANLSPLSSCQVQGTIAIVPTTSEEIAFFEDESFTTTIDDFFPFLQPESERKDSGSIGSIYSTFCTNLVNENQLVQSTLRTRNVFRQHFDNEIDIHDWTDDNYRVSEDLERLLDTSQVIDPPCPTDTHVPTLETKPDGLPLSESSISQLSTRTRNPFALKFDDFSLAPCSSPPRICFNIMHSRRIRDASTYLEPLERQEKIQVQHCTTHSTSSTVCNRNLADPRYRDQSQPDEFDGEQSEDIVSKKHPTSESKTRCPLSSLNLEPHLPFHSNYRTYLPPASSSPATAAAAAAKAAAASFSSSTLSNSEKSNSFLSRRHSHLVMWPSTPQHNAVPPGVSKLNPKISARTHCPERITGKNAMQPQKEHEVNGNNGTRRRRHHLLQFILELLRRGHQCVKWVDRVNYVFSILHPEQLTRLWGRYKRNSRMTFDSLSRSLRLYYAPGKLARVQGHRNQYRLLFTDSE